jgi:signal transduction histidine kinase
LKIPLKRRLTSSLTVVFLTAVLLLLAVLQYRWSNEVSKATTVRLRADLQTSLVGFRQGLYRELASACVPFQMSLRAGDPWTQFAEHYNQWSRSAAHPELVVDVYIWRRMGDGSAELQRLNEHGLFESAQWPSDFEPLRGMMESLPKDMPPPGFRPAPDNQSGKGIPRPPSPGVSPFPWTFEQSIPALVHPVFAATPPFEAGKEEKSHAISWVIIQLSRRILDEEIFPELAERYFGGSNGYRVAVLAGRGGPIVYSSDRELNPQQLANAEGSINLFGPPRNSVDQRSHSLPNPVPFGGNERPGGDAGGFWGIRFEPLHMGDNSSDWQLLALHRRGSLEGFVAAIRQRNLAISFGILLILAATMAVIVSASRRAQRLAQLQMDFVAAVSHELRTPLTVISSAAENIVDGVVVSRAQTIRYGSVIKSQAKQLVELVEQVLLFAATRQDSYRYEIRELQVSDLIESALESTAVQIRTVGVTVEKHVEPDLPPVEGDPNALSRCLQNLISNAVKYGGDARWLAIRASLVRSGVVAEIQIMVEDRGPGIPQQDLEHIFEPFYRGGWASAAQIHGTGLGLPLAKRIAEAMNGRLTVSSRPNEGSKFVLHLPVVNSAELARETDKTAVFVRR